jgi:hypothetical protein
MRRLSRSPLPKLPPSVRQSQYDRESLKVGMAHIGVGAFRIIGSLRQVIDIADKASAEAAIAALGGPEISVVTIAVTEKGYCLTPSTARSNSTIRRSGWILKAAFRPGPSLACRRSLSSGASKRAAPR